MILKDIKRNQYRVSDILRRMALILNAEEEELDTEHVLTSLKNLFREQLINDEQFNALKDNINDLTMAKRIWEIKSTKVGRGVDFLPRKTHDLFAKLKQWAGELATEGTAILRQKVLGVLDELLSRKAITKTQYNDVKEADE